MTSPYLVGDLKIEEGCRLTAYPDPRSGGVPWTIGYGHTGPEVHPGLTWTQAQAEGALAVDVGAATTGVRTALPWFTSLDDLRQDVLVDMAFNMGVHGLLEFKTFLGFVKAGEFPQAALDLKGTPWYHEVGERSARLCEQLATGAHVPPT